MIGMHKWKDIICSGRTDIVKGLGEAFRNPTKWSKQPFRKHKAKGRDMPVEFLKQLIDITRKHYNIVVMGNFYLS